MPLAPFNPYSHVASQILFNEARQITGGDHMLEWLLVSFVLALGQHDDAPGVERAVLQAFGPMHNVKPRLEIACTNCLAPIVNNPRLTEKNDTSLDMADGNVLDDLASAGIDPRHLLRGPVKALALLFKSVAPPGARP